MCKLLLLPLLPGLMGLAAGAQAQVSFYNSLTTFQTFSSAQIVSTFESLAYGTTPTFTEGGIKFASATPYELYVVTPGSGEAQAFVPNPKSNILTANGNEVIDLTFSPAGIKALGFSVYTDDEGVPIVTAYDLADNLIGTYALTQGYDALGFVGLTSSVAIGRVRYTAANDGYHRNSAIDDVRVEAVPEPCSLAALGLGALVAVRKRKLSKFL